MPPRDAISAHNVTSIVRNASNRVFPMHQPLLEAGYLEEKVPENSISLSLEFRQYAHSRAIVLLLWRCDLFRDWPYLYILAFMSKISKPLILDFHAFSRFIHAHPFSSVFIPSFDYD